MNYKCAIVHSYVKCPEGNMKMWKTHGEIFDNAGTSSTLMVDLFTSFWVCLYIAYMIKYDKYGDKFVQRAFTSRPAQNRKASLASTIDHAEIRHAILESPTSPCTPAPLPRFSSPARNKRQMGGSCKFPAQIVDVCKLFGHSMAIIMGMEHYSLLVHCPARKSAWGNGRLRFFFAANDRPARHICVPKVKQNSPRSINITIAGWWYTYPSEKYELVSWNDEIPNIWKNKTCSKPPTSIGYPDNLPKDLPSGGFLNGGSPSHHGFQFTKSWSSITRIMIRGYPT